MRRLREAELGELTNAVDIFRWVLWLKKIEATTWEAQLVGVAGALCLASGVGDKPCFVNEENKVVFQEFRGLVTCKT